MKNLQLSFCYQKNINISDRGKLVLDSNGSNNNLYLYTNDGIAIYDELKDSTELLYGLMEVVGCEHLAINNELCAASKYGEVILINPSTKETQEVTFCEGGIKRMSWSHDQEIVVFVTERNMVVVMTCTFDIISECSLDDVDFGDQQFITVGWGKKETQFHGSEGKEAAKQKLNFVIPKNFDELDKTINITWRGDSELFAVSFVSSIGRMFKVYNKEGKLQYTSEKINDLGACIAWKPSGSWIAVPHCLPNKYTIALFEKNGLRHRELILPFKHEDEPIVNISWSTDSDILCVETVKDDRSNLYLYIISNYHWYLKQCLQFHSKISNSLWDLEMNEGKTLHILLANGSYFHYKWIFAVNHSFGNTIHDQSIVAVIDGNKLLVSDFRNNIIPPPMSSFVLESPSYINSCGFIRNSRDARFFNQLFFVTVDNKISFYDLEYETISERQRIKTMKFLRCVKQSDEESNIPLSKNHWMWLSDDSIVFCENKENKSVLCLAYFNTEILEIASQIRLDGLVSHVINAKLDICLIQLKNGVVYSIDIKSNKYLENSNIFSKLTDISEQIEAVEIDNVLKVVSLQSNRNLYVDSTKIASDVTSFFIAQKYLVFTLISSIKFMRISDNLIVDERKLERGGKIIVIVPHSSRVVIQMPRGNLETINPRVLSLDIVGELLDKLSYRKAMDMLRKERINLNIIVDHNPKVFLKQIDTFLDEVSNPHWLNLFLSELQNDDFTKTMYFSNYNKSISNYPDDYCVDNKINFVCQKMCKHMEENNFQHFLLPIITTYVKTGNLEKALDVIWTEKKNEMDIITDQDDSSKKINSEEALKYLLYLVDVNSLYDVALGMYDFGLVLYVANKSQKDPKEYVPFLNQLKQLEENYRRFKIDEHLKRYEKALEHIAKCGDSRLEECIQFVQKHTLFQKALSVFENNEEGYKEIALAFGDHLRAQGKHENASIMYERGGDLLQAILSAKHVLDWTRCLVLTKTLTNNDREELRNISLSLVTALLEKGKFDEAWFLIKNYVGDFSRALECLLRGRHYLKAIYEVKMEDSTLVGSMIVSHLKDYKKTLQMNLNSDREQFIKYKIRLSIVRKERAQRNADNVYEDGVDECDLLSDTSSIKSSNYTGSSRGTGKTFRSSKNRRKHERKLLSLKEGNPFEDIALIDALYNLITRIIGQQVHIHETCKALMEICCDKEAKEIQYSFAELLLAIRDSLDEIWIPELMTSQQLIGPNIDYAQLQNEQRYAMINLQKRHKPQLNLIDWEHEILR